MAKTIQPRQQIVISEEQVREHLNVSRLTRTLEEAFGREVGKTAIVPVRTRMELPSGGVLLTMPCSDIGLGVFGIKLVTVGEPPDRVNADYFLYDSATRKRLAAISANYLTDLRTACMSAIATKLLARSESRVLGVFGTGRQAWAHVLALSEILPFTTVLCCGSKKEKSQHFAQLVREILDFEAYPCPPEQSVRESDVVCCCTTSPVPIFDGTIVKDGTHLNVIGAFEKGHREIDGCLLKRSLVYVETYEAVLSEGGDVACAIDEGWISKDHVRADLHDLLQNRVVGRERASDITVFKSVGYAYEDLLAATLVYDTITGNLRRESWVEHAKR